MVREEKGVASKLVYQLKMKLDVMSRDVEKSKLGGTLGRTVTARTRTSLAVADSYLGVGSFNSAHAAYETAKSKIFEDVVRSREIKPNFLLEEAATVRFRAEGERQAADVLDHTLTLRASIDEHVAERRAHQLNAFNASRETKAIHVAAQYATHAEMLEARREVEKREVEIELAIAEKNRLLAVARNDAARGEALDGIDAFERNLQRMAGAGGGSTDGGESTRDDVASATPLTGVDPVEHLERLRRTLPDQRQLTEAGARTVARIKSGKAELDAARRERDRRRHKTLTDQTRNAAVEEARRREDELLATLGARSAQETRVAERLRALERERETTPRPQRGDARYEEHPRRIVSRCVARRNSPRSVAPRPRRRRRVRGAFAEAESARERERAAEVRRFVRGWCSTLPVWPSGAASTARPPRSSSREGNTASGSRCW